MSLNGITKQEITSNRNVITNTVLEIKIKNKVRQTSESNHMGWMGHILRMNENKLLY